MNLDHSIVGVTSSPDTHELDAALSVARSKFLAVKKSANNKFAGFRYPTYADMAQATFKALHEAGVVLKFSSGFVTHPAYTGEVMVGKLSHPKSKQWEASTVPKRYPVNHKTGAIQEDGQGLETADAYCKKALVMELTGAWLEGDEPEVQQDQAKKEAESVMTEAGAPPAVDFFNKLNAKMKAVRSIPAELEKAFRDAESLAESGDLTADQFARLNRQFGALRKKEVAHA
jgi:hypothetical protein